MRISRDPVLQVLQVVQQGMGERMCAALQKMAGGMANGFSFPYASQPPTASLEPTDQQ